MIFVLYLLVSMLKALRLILFSVLYGLPNMIFLLNGASRCKPTIVTGFGATPPGTTSWVVCPETWFVSVPDQQN